MSDKSNPAHLNEVQGRVLVQLARQTIMEKLNIKPDQDSVDTIQDALDDDRLNIRRGTFVTLKMDNQLRGCIGTLGATENLVDSVRKNAINAAFNDYRFSPLTGKELDRVQVEISILTEPKPLEYIDGDDLLTLLRPNVDGVILRKGAASATFLPQVWEQLPKPEDFLSHLCQKAGLASTAWRDDALQVSTYQVQYFEEEA